MRHLQESRTPSIDCFNCLVGAEHDYLSLCGQFCQDVRKVSKVGDSTEWCSFRLADVQFTLNKIARDPSCD
jgi:hypothetical protein